MVASDGFLASPRYDVVGQSGYDNGFYMWAHSSLELKPELLWSSGLDPQRSKELRDALVEKGLAKKVSPGRTSGNVLH